MIRLALGGRSQFLGVYPMQGEDPADSLNLGWLPEDPLPALRRGVAGIRLGRISLADCGPLLDHETAAAYEAAIETLALLGATILPIALPRLLSGYAEMTSVLAGEGYAAHGKLAEDPDSEIGPHTHMRLLSGKISAHDYLGPIRTIKILRQPCDEPGKGAEKLFQMLLHHGLGRVRVTRGDGIDDGGMLADQSRCRRCIGEAEVPHAVHLQFDVLQCSPDALMGHGYGESPVKIVIEREKTGVITLADGGRLLPDQHAHLRNVVWFGLERGLTNDRPFHCRPQEPRAIDTRDGYPGHNRGALGHDTHKTRFC
jgi:hypothetical protein